MSNNQDEFRTVRRRNKKSNYLSNYRTENDDNQYCMLDYNQWKKRIDSKMEFIRESYFWNRFRHYFSEWITCQSDSIDLLVYGLGHISSSMAAQYQYALLKLIHLEFNEQIMIIFLYDPIWTNQERDFLRQDDSNEKYQIVEENNQACQSIVRSSFIYIPFCAKPIHNNFLYSNWSKEQLKKILFFGNSLDKFCDEIHFDENKYVFIKEARRFSEDISLPTFDHFMNAFNEQVFTMFDRTSRQEKDLSIKTNIECVDDHLWLLHSKPIYTNDDEIIISSSLT